MAQRSVYPQTKGEVELMQAFNSLAASHADLVTKFNAVLAKLDADAGVTDTDYASTQAASSTSVDTLRTGTAR